VKSFDLVWTIPGQEELELIYEYYSLKSETAAFKIVDTILSRVFQLKKFPLSGQEEQFLKKANKGYRYIVAGNYKIIYRIEGSVVYITDVFDVRQNPKKITRHK
jgi:toxin ParE1/3/4